jgi:hypothetical protein
MIVPERLAVRDKKHDRTRLKQLDMNAVFDEPFYLGSATDIHNEQKTCGLPEKGIKTALKNKNG